MSTLYWIMVFGNLCEVASVLFILSLIATPVLTIAYLACRNEDFEESTIKFLAKASKVACSVLVVATVLCIFTPSKKELYMIYGVGGTIDYLKQNPTAKQLPDKCIKAIDKWVENLAKDDKSNKEE